MSGADPAARLIPWYAAGTLGAEESAEVEAHLASCEECRGLLALARGFRRLAPTIGEADLFDHIQAQRLAEFAEDPSALEPEARRFITNHIRTCAPCAEALEILEDLGSAPADGAPQADPGDDIGFADRARRAWDDLWRRMSRTVLRPAPAFAYLAALLVILISVPLRAPVPRPDGGASAPGGDGGAPGPAPIPAPGPGPTPGPAPIPAPLPGGSAFRTMAAAIPLPEEVVFRDGTPAPMPLEIPLPAGADLVPVEMRTSIEREDLQDAAVRFHVRIVQADGVLFDETLPGAAFDRRGRLTLVLDIARAATGIPCRATIVRVKPGDPADGEELYRRSFVLVAAPPVR